MSGFCFQSRCLMTFWLSSEAWQGLYTTHDMLLSQQQMEASRENCRASWRHLMPIYRQLSKALVWNSFHPLRVCNLNVSMQARCSWLLSLTGRKKMDAFSWCNSCVSPLIEPDWLNPLWLWSSWGNQLRGASTAVIQVKSDYSKTENPLWQFAHLPISWLLRYELCFQFPLPGLILQG